jgi:hypothetical protein
MPRAGLTDQSTWTYLESVFLTWKESLGTRCSLVCRPLDENISGGCPEVFELRRDLVRWFRAFHLHAKSHGALPECQTVESCNEGIAYIPENQIGWRGAAQQTIVEQAQRHSFGELGPRTQGSITSR